MDEENGVLKLSAPEGLTGSTLVTVSVSDGNGGVATQTFNVNIIPDNSNSEPFLDDIPTLTTAINTPVTHQLSAQDVEGDSFVFLGQATIDTLNESLLPEFQIALPARAPAGLGFTVDPSSGLLTVMPTLSLTGTHQISVAVVSSLTNLTNSSPIDFQVIDVTIG